ncbi:MAG: PAS domain S-box protein, partial [Sedimentisphaerales bacterium]|nr:PAS domain S-box protein [Sedimentisphaerales bacterium]
AQQDLEQARNHYTTVFNLAPVGYIAVYEDTVVKEINSAAAGMFGHDRLDILGNPLVIYVQPQGRDALRKHFQKVFTGNEDTTELIFDRHNSKSFIGRLHSRLIQDGPSSVRCCLCTLTDMSETIAAQRQLHERQDQLRRIEQRSRELEQARTELEQEVHKRSHALDLSQKQIEQINGELRRQQATQKQIESELKQQQEELETRKRNQQEELERLTEKLRQKDDDHVLQLREKETQIQDRQEACRRLEEALDRERKRLLETEAKQSEALRQLQDMLTRQQTEQETIQQELLARRQPSAPLQDENIRQLELTNTELQKRLCEMRITEQKLRRRVEQFRKYVRFRTQRLNEASVQLQQLQQKNERLCHNPGRRQQGLSAGMPPEIEENGVLRSEPDRSTERLGRQLTRLTKVVQAQKRRLQKIVEEKKGRQASAQLIHQEHLKERRDLQQRVRQAERRIEQLQSRLHERTESVRNMRCLFRESETMFETTCRLARIGQWTYDLLKGQFIASRQLQRLLSPKSSAIISDLEGFLAIVHPDDRQKMHQIFHEPVCRRKPFHVEHRTIPTDGSQRILLHCVKRITIKDADLLIGVCRDITEWRDKETKLNERTVLLEQSVQEQHQRIETLEEEIRQRTRQYRVLENKLIEQRDALLATLKGTEELLAISKNHIQETCARQEQEDVQARKKIKVLQSEIEIRSEQLKEVENKLHAQQAKMEQLQDDWTSRQRRFEHINAESARQFRTITVALRERVFHHAQKRRAIELQHDQIQKSLDALGLELAQTRERFAKQIMDHKRIQQRLMNDKQVLQQQIEIRNREMEQLRAEMEKQQKDHRSYTQRLTDQIHSLRTELHQSQEAQANPIDSQREERMTELQILLAERTEDLENVLRTSSAGLHSPLADLARCADRLEELCHRHHLAESRPTLERIFDRLGQAGNVVQALNQLSDVAADELDEINVNLIIEDILKENPHFSRNNVTFRIDKLPPCRADALQLKKVFTQLIDNAVKFGKTGTDHCVWIDGRTEGKTSIYCVEDNGIGMLPEKLDHAFGMFTQIDPKHTSGWGIGLAVVKRIIERHGGRITVETQPGIGSKFFVTLPRQ